MFSKPKQQMFSKPPATSAPPQPKRFKLTLNIPGQSEPRIWETTKQPYYFTTAVTARWVDPETQKETLLLHGTLLIEEV